MTETILQRKTALQIRPEEIEERDRIIDSARKLLGYQRDDAYPVRLLQALQELGIQPFDEKTVAEYKRAALEARRKLARLADWERADLSDFSKTQDIPVRVLQTAIRIKEKLGNQVGFKVEYLASDPFLIAYQINSAGHRVGDFLYVDVWDEKGFEELLFGVDSATVGT